MAFNAITFVMRSWLAPPIRMMLLGPSVLKMFFHA
jgi:hypothetical protein